MADYRNLLGDDFNQLDDTEKQKRMLDVGFTHDGEQWVPPATEPAPESALGNDFN